MTVLSEILSTPVYQAASTVEPITLRIDERCISDPEYYANVLHLQEFLTFAAGQAPLRLLWTKEQLARFSAAPNSNPLLSCCVLHQAVAHKLEDSHDFLVVTPLQKQIEKTRIGFDWFSESQAVLCADHLGLGRPKDLYASASAPGIRPREDFEELVFPYIERQLAVDLDEKAAFRWRAAFASVIYELFENTDLHGRTDAEKRLLKTSIRGILFRTIPLQGYQPSPKAAPSGARCIEISVFDSGVGYFEKNMRIPLTDEISIKEEWRVLHECLSAHLEDAPMSPHTPGHHGIGLYEVLRALKFLGGSIEIRTGRLHGYRSFLPGDLSVQMESSDSVSRPNMPKATLLDYARKYIRVPTAHPRAQGSAIRVQVPIV